MRLKLDENLPVELAEFLASLNHTVDGGHEQRAVTRTSL